MGKKEEKFNLLLYPQVWDESQLFPVLAKHGEASCHLAFVLRGGTRESVCLSVPNVGQEHSYQLNTGTNFCGTGYNWVQSPRQLLSSNPPPAHT